MRDDRPPVGSMCQATSRCTWIAETWWTYPHLGRVAVCGIHAAALRAARGGDS